MSNLTVKIDDCKHLVDSEFVKDLNCFVTEERIRRPESNRDETESKETLVKSIPEMDFAKNDDFYEVIKEGSLEGLKLNLEYEFGEEADFIELISYVIEYLASRQIFGNGNKRTSFLVAYFLIF